MRAKSSLFLILAVILLATLSFSVSAATIRIAANVTGNSTNTVGTKATAGEANPFVVTNLTDADYVSVGVIDDNVYALGATTCGVLQTNWTFPNVISAQLSWAYFNVTQCVAWNYNEWATLMLWNFSANSWSNAVVQFRTTLPENSCNSTSINITDLLSDFGKDTAAGLLMVTSINESYNGGICSAHGVNIDQILSVIEYGEGHSTAPSISAFTNNGTNSGLEQDINWSFAASSGIGVSQWVLATNNTGSFVNGSFHLVSGSSSITASEVVTGVPHGVSCGFVWVNDTINNASMDYACLNNTDLITPWVGFAAPTPTNNTPIAGNSVTINVSFVEAFNASFVINLNGTNYTGSSITAGDGFFFRKFGGLASGTNYTFYGFVADASGNKNVTETRIFLPNDAYLDGCSANSVRAINFSVASEGDTDFPLTADWEISGVYWRQSNTSDVRNITTSASASNFKALCIGPGDVVLSADLYIKQFVSGGFTHRYYLYGVTLTNATINLTLYNFNYTTGVSLLKITTRYDSNYKYFENVVTKLQRFYAAEGAWRTVQMDKSDSYGLNIFNIIEESVDYQFLFYDTQNQLLKSTSSMKFVCAAAVCDVVTTMSPYSGVTVAPISSFSWSYNNNTKNLTAAWSSDTTATANVVVIKGDLTIFNVTQTGNSGSININLTNYTGSAIVRASVNGVVQGVQWIELGGVKLSQYLSTAESTWWSFVLVLVIMCAGLASPVMCVIFGIVGLFMLYFLGMSSPVSLALIISGIIVGVVISLKVKV